MLTALVPLFLEIPLGTTNDVNNDVGAMFTATVTDDLEQTSEVPCGNQETQCICQNTRSLNNDDAFGWNYILLHCNDAEKM